MMMLKQKKIQAFQAQQRMHTYKRQLKLPISAKTAHVQYSLFTKDTNDSSVSTSGKRRPNSRYILGVKKRNLRISQ